MNTILTHQLGCVMSVSRVICQGKGKYQSIRDKVLEYSLKILRNNDAFMVKDTMNLFKDKILQQHGCTISDNDWESYRKTLGTHL